MRHRLALPAIVLSVFCLLSGCAGLQKALDQNDPLDKGNPAAQLAVTAQQATTQPAVKSGVAIAGDATGQVWLPYALAGVTGLLGLLAALFHSKASGQQAQLDVLQEAHDVASNAEAVALSASGNSPTVSKAIAGVQSAAGAVSEIAPLVGAVVPRIPPAVIADVKEVAGAIAK